MTLIRGESVFSLHYYNALYIMHRIATVTLFAGLCCFPQGHNFKQWTSNDSKAIMKVGMFLFYIWFIPTTSDINSRSIYLLLTGMSHPKWSVQSAHSLNSDIYCSRMSLMNKLSSRFRKSSIDSTTTVKSFRRKRWWHHSHSPSNTLWSTMSTWYTYLVPPIDYVYW